MFGFDRMKLRRYKRYNSLDKMDEDIIVHSELPINIKTHECTMNDERINLIPTEFAILRILCQRKGEVISSEDLFHEIWGYGYKIEG